MFRTHIILFQGQKLPVPGEDLNLISHRCSIENDLNFEIHEILCNKKKEMQFDFERIINLVGGICEIVCFGIGLGATLMYDILEKIDIDYKSVLSIQPTRKLLDFRKNIITRPGIASMATNIYTPKIGLRVVDAMNVVCTPENMQQIVMYYLKKSITHSMVNERVRT